MGLCICRKVVSTVCTPYSEVVGSGSRRFKLRRDGNGGAIS